MKISANDLEVSARGKPITVGKQVDNTVRKFKSKYGEGEVKKYYTKYGVAISPALIDQMI